MPIQPVHYGARRHVPDAEGVAVLGVAQQVLPAPRPGDPGMGVVIVLVAVQVAHLPGGSGLEHDVARRVRGSGQVPAVGGRGQAEDGEGDVILEAPDGVGCGGRRGGGGI